MNIIVIILLILTVIFFVLGILTDLKKKRIEREEIENTITQTLSIRDLNPDKKSKKEEEEDSKPVMLKSILVKDKVELFDDEKI